jgi:hypothetical protein
MADQLDTRWNEISERHSAAVREFLTVGTALSAAWWRAPIAAGKWTPAQITQHLIQTYEIVIRQLRTGEGLNVQTGWLVRQVLRIVVLRPIMWTRRLPPGAKAARVLLPDVTEIDQGTALARLRDVAAEFEAELSARRGQAGLQLTHHIFGSVDAVDGLDFVAVHTEHHCRQLSRVMSRAQSTPTATNPAG